MRTMKYYLLIATAFVALASCSDDSFMGENSSPSSGQDETQPIVFNSGANAVTRADHVGADAAGLLNNKFIVGGFKGNGTAMTQVFDNYIVKWNSNTAGKTASNTSDWEYVGVTAAAPSKITGLQTIKFWDYSTTQYDFAAFSTGDIPANKVLTSGEPGAGQVLISGISKADTYAGPTYTITGAAADLAKCYISDLVTVYKSDYQKEVLLTFRNLVTKVRVALYETIPGYSVKDVKFYSDNATTLATGTSETKMTLFAPNTGDADKFFNAGTATVTFKTIGSTNIGNTDYNKAHVTFTATSGGTSDDKNFGTLNYTTAADREAAGSIYLARNSNNPTFAGNPADNYYLIVLPNETGTVLELRVDYTLVATDGSGEEIKVHGAKAYVPAIYATWKSNYAYTYLFKISDNTNGWTSTTESDPAGLYPITFDAVVADSKDGTQSTITTVTTPAITTYQKGHVYTDNDYDDDKGDIYVMVQDAFLKDNLNTKGQLYTVTGTDISEATVMEALNIQESTSGSTITGRNGIALTTASSTPVVEIAATDSPDGNAIPVTTKVVLWASTPPSDWLSDYMNYYYDEACTQPSDQTIISGRTYYRKNTAVKFTPTAGTYAYTYLVEDKANSYIYTAVNFAAGASQPDDWSGNYWNNPNGTGSAVTTFDSSSAVTYYRRYTNLNKVYAVKVIKVVD